MIHKKLLGMLGVIGLMTITAKTIISNDVTISNRKFMLLQAVSTTENSGSFTGWIVFAIIALFITGVVLGVKKKIVVYNDFHDTVISLLIFVFPLIIIFMKEKTPIYIVGVIEISLLSYSLYQTCRSNKSVLTIVFSFLIKTVMSFLLVFTIKAIIDGILSNKNQYNRDEVRTRNFLLVILGGIAWLIFNMIYIRKWMATGDELDNMADAEQEYLKKKNKISVYLCVGIGLILSIFLAYKMFLKSKNEDFNTFFEQFKTDSVFQKERVTFPFRVENVSYDGTGTEVINIESSKWKFQDNWWDSTCLTRGLDEYDQTIEDMGDSTVIYYNGIGNGINFRRIFKQEDGRWYYTSLVDESD